MSKFMKKSGMMCLYFIGIFMILGGLGSFVTDVKFGFTTFVIGLIILPPLRNKINVFLKPKFYSLANKDCKTPSAIIDMAYGIIKFIILFLLLVYSTPSDGSMPATSTKPVVNYKQLTEEEIHQEHMNYIRHCADTDNYIDCMNKRPEIR